MAEILHRLGYIASRQVVDRHPRRPGRPVRRPHRAEDQGGAQARLGGVLFIDEAYYLYRPENERDYGQEAIEILLQVMENHRDDLVVILAGYADRMDVFFRSNPGMSSRIAHHIDFPDYNVDELVEIARADGRASSATSCRPRPRRRFRALPRAAHARSRASPTRAASATRSSAPGCARPTRLFERARRALEPRGRWPRSRPRTSWPAGCSTTDEPARSAAHAPPVILGVVGDSAAGKTTHHARPRAGARRGAGHPHLHRRLPPLRPQAARGARHHAAAPRVQLHGHHRAGPRAPAHGRADPEAGLPAHATAPSGRPMYVEPQPVHRRRGPARLPHARRCATSTTCASSSPRPRTCGASGRCSATARGAATRPTRCWPSSTAASRLRGVHPPAGAVRRHRGVVHAGRPRRPGPPRRRADPARRARRTRT